MAEKNFIKINIVLDRLLRKYNLKTSVSYNQIIMDWKKIVGSTLEKQCRPVKMTDKILFIETKNSIWRHELTLKKAEMINLINNYFKERIIKGIKFL